MSYKLPAREDVANSEDSRWRVLIPFYADCVLINYSDGKLMTQVEWRKTPEHQADLDRAYRHGAADENEALLS